jgi:hypothetical protein
VTKLGKESLLKAEQSSDINCIAAAVFLQHRDVHQPLEFLSSASHPWLESDEGLITFRLGDMLESAAMWTIVGSTRTTRLSHFRVCGHFKMDGPHGRHLCLILTKALTALLRSAPSKLLDPPTRPAKS